MNVHIPLLITRFIFGKTVGKREGIRRIRGGVLGITFSLIPLVFVHVVANGMISGITIRFLETGTYHLQLHARNNASSESTSETIAEISQLEAILHVFPENQGLALLAGGRGHNGVQIRGVAPEIYNLDSSFSQYLELVSGNFDLSENRNIVLGENIANTLNIQVGDTVRLITARTQSVDTIIPRVSRFTVRGIISTGYRELDALWVFLRIDDAQQIIPPYEIREIIGVKVDNPYLLDEESQDLNFINSQPRTAGVSNIVNDIRNIADDKWRVFTWYDLEESQYMSFITTRNLLLFIMLLIVLVAAVNISSAMIMLVLEKQEEIAILKALGIRHGEIMLIILCAGGVTGAIGIGMGLSIGSLIAFNVNEIISFVESLINWFSYAGIIIFSPESTFIPLELFSHDFYLTTIPVMLRFSDLVIMALVTLALSLFMSFLPALKAVKLKPLELLHRQ